ncbi:hypothetical protein JCM1841_004457 [Sporobolomyces salmonicolor]
MFSLPLRSAPRAALRNPCTCTCLSSSSRLYATATAVGRNSFSRPSPPPLPPQQQREFEELLRRVNAPASPPAADVKLHQPEESEFHPDYRARPKANFEGEVNPETGEVGGPKNEPLTHGDWAYGGKVTDF